MTFPKGDRWEPGDLPLHRMSRDRWMAYAANELRQPKGNTPLVGDSRDILAFQLEIAVFGPYRISLSRHVKEKGEVREGS